MKLSPHIQLLDAISSSMLNELWAAASCVDLNDSASLTKEDAFLGACNRYEIETRYFHSGQSFYSGVLPSLELTRHLERYHHLLTTKYFPDHVIFRAQVVRNLPGKIIHPHIDLRLYHQLAHRIHAVLTTNEKCGHVYFDEATYEAKICHMHSGNLYDFDNITPHAAFNLGQTDRVHVISDVIHPQHLQRYEHIFRVNPNFTLPKSLADYQVHLNAINSKYGQKEGLYQYYLDNINSQ